MAFKQVFFLIFILSQIISCTSSKKLVYFNGVRDTAFLNLQPVAEIRIVPNDILSIVISSLSPEASALFNPDATTPIRATTITGINTERGAILLILTGIFNYRY